MHVRHGSHLGGRRFPAASIAAAVMVLSCAASACTASPSPVAPSTATTEMTPTGKVVTNSAVVAIDDVGPGFNPHELADISPVSDAVSSLVLPSVFRPNGDDPSGNSWNLDPSIAVSATPSTDPASRTPFTVTYVLRNAAQWSDGAPIAAEDFRYLWEQMTSQAGVVDRAGYSLIDDVASSEGGKTVTVTFTQPYPAWRELFRNLLPAHLLKDLPGGFTSALDDVLPVSGSRFKVKTVDRDRGEVLLERNDRFWDKPTVLDSVLLRRDGTAGQLAESLRTNDAQVAQVHADDATYTQLAAIPALRTLAVPQPSTLRLAVNVTPSGIPDNTVRGGLLGLLDPDALSTIGAGRIVTADQARAQILVPSQPGYVPTAPPTPSAASAKADLQAAGYSLRAGRYVKNDVPLSVVVGAAKSDTAATSVAQAVADQLTAAGVNATADILSASELYGSALGSGTVSMLVGRAPAGGDPATTLASTFGCAKPAPARSPSTPSTTTPSATPSDGVSTTRVGNVSGVCDPKLQPQIEAALTGKADAAAVAALEPKLWALHAVLPLYQDSTLLAVSQELTGVGNPQSLLAGPLSTAATWARTGR